MYRSEVTGSRFPPLSLLKIKNATSTYVTSQSKSNEMGGNTILRYRPI